MAGTLDIAGHSFPLREEPPGSGRFMLFSVALRDRDLAGVYDFLEVIAAEPTASDGTSLRDAVGEVETLQEIDHAIGEALKNYHADPPTKRSADSAAGPPTTAGTSRVVSFARGTVEEVPAESSTG